MEDPERPNVGEAGFLFEEVVLGGNVGIQEFEYPLVCALYCLNMSVVTHARRTPSLRWLGAPISSDATLGPTGAGLMKLC
jgi:hypothetical protein